MTPFASMKLQALVWNHRLYTLSFVQSKIEDRLYKLVIVLYTNLILLQDPDLKLCSTVCVLLCHLTVGTTIVHRKAALSERESSCTTTQWNPKKIRAAIFKQRSVRRGRSALCLRFSFSSVAVGALEVFLLQTTLIRVGSKLYHLDPP